MTDITRDCNAGLITQGEYETQRAQREAELGDSEAFWDEVTAAPYLELPDREINAMDAAREAAEQEAIEDETQPGGPLRNPETGQPYDEATQERLINEARYAEPVPDWGQEGNDRRPAGLWTFRDRDDLVQYARSHGLTVAAVEGMAERDGVRLFKGGAESRGEGARADAEREAAEWRDRNGEAGPDGYLAAPVEAEVPDMEATDAPYPTREQRADYVRERAMPAPADWTRDIEAGR